MCCLNVDAGDYDFALDGLRVRVYRLERNRAEGKYGMARDSTGRHGTARDGTGAYGTRAISRSVFTPSIVKTTVHTTRHRNFPATTGGLPRGPATLNTGCCTLFFNVFDESTPRDARRDKVAQT